jgi:putative transposase
MCHVLGVKSNNFYSFQKRKVSAADNPTYQKMIDLIKDIAKFSDNTYGARRIKKVLNTLSFPHTPITLFMYAVF